MKLSTLEKALADAGIEDARTEARLLFCHVTGIPMHRLLGCDPDTEDTRLAQALSHRLRREPLAYILGYAPFYRETYKVTPAVLIPRADTEILVEHAIRLLPPNARFADFCTGSGCIAVSVLAARPDCRAVAYDISKEALAIARENAVSNGVADRIAFACADLLTEHVSLDGVAAVLSNPPYITDDEMSTLAPELSFEPEHALRAPEKGLLFYRTFLSRYSKKGLPSHAEAPFFLFEIGHTQFADVSRLAAQNGFSAACFPDLEGRDRVALCKPVLAHLL